MALMTTMREKMHVVLWTLLALFLLSMTIGGLVGGANIIDQIFGNINPQTTIASINGELISPDQFNNLVNQQMNSIKSSGQTLNDFQIKRARDKAWDNLIQDVLVTQEVKKLNLSASEEEVIYHLENNPPPFLQQNPTFQSNGIFDREKYLQALANPESNEWAPIENFMKNTFIPNFKLQKILDESIIITDNEITEEFIKRNVEYTINGIHITTKQLSDGLAIPTEDEIQNEYNKRKEDFGHDELRSISYVSWAKTPSSLDTIEAQTISNELYNRAKSGEDFFKLANIYSMDPGNQGTKGGDLGWFKRGRMVEQFEEAAFNAGTNQIVGPVLSNFGYHIINVRDKRINENSDEEILASHILIKIDVSSTTLSNLKREATLFSYDAQDNGFLNATDNQKLIISKHEKFDSESVNITGIGPLRSLIKFAFDNELSTVSDVYENDQHYIVCTIDTVIAPGTKDLNEIRPRIENQLRKEKLKFATLEKANTILIKISADDISLEALIKAEKDIDSFLKEKKKINQGFTGIGRSNFVNGALLEGLTGKILGPLETSNGHALLEILEISEFDSLEYFNQKEQIRKSLFSLKQNQYFQAWLENLKKNSDIIDNRKFYF